MLRSSIATPLVLHDKERLTQGDILRDFTFYFIDSEKEIIEVTFPYVVILSQDCDLEQGQKEFDYFKYRQEEASVSFNQLLPNILISPAFVDATLKDGEHLLDNFNIRQERINSDKFRLIKQNGNNRYHYVPRFPDLQVPDLIIDFKVYFTVPTDFVLKFYSECYLATINELHRELLSQRFCNFLNRIGLPE